MSAAPCEMALERARVLDRLPRALREERNHRMRGVADQRDPADGIVWRSARVHRAARRASRRPARSALAPRATRRRRRASARRDRLRRPRDRSPGLSRQPASMVATKLTSAAAAQRIVDEMSAAPSRRLTSGAEIGRRQFARRNGGAERDAAGETPACPPRRSRAARAPWSAGRRRRSRGRRAPARTAARASGRSVTPSSRLSDAGDRERRAAVRCRACDAQASASARCRSAR